MSIRKTKFNVGDAVKTPEGVPDHERETGPVTSWPVAAPPDEQMGQKEE